MPGISWARDLHLLESFRDTVVTPEAVRDRFAGRRTYDAVRMKLHELGIPHTSSKSTPAVQQSDEVVRYTETQTGATLESPRSGRITSLEQLLAASDVDLEVWQVERYKVNSWQGPDGRDLFQVKADLKRNPLACQLKALRADLLQDIRRTAPRLTRPAAPAPNGDHLLEISLPDLHLGKLAWREESGADYDLDIAQRDALAAVDALIERSRGHTVERVLVVVGNDLLQADNLIQTTTAGTHQDTDSRWLKMFRAARTVQTAIICRALDVAPVEVVVVPGNHDHQSALALGEVLDAQYSGTKAVTVDTSPKLRKYFAYGCTLLGLTHGKEEKPADLPLLMAQEVPHMWAEARHKEWHVGHLHKMKETRYTAGDSFQGVRVRILPSLSGTDAWHFAKGYVKEHRAAEAYLWDRNHGYAGHFNYTVQPELKAA